MGKSEGFIFLWGWATIAMAVLVLMLVIVVWLIDVECEELSKRIETLEEKARAKTLAEIEESDVKRREGEP